MSGGRRKGEDSVLLLSWVGVCVCVCLTATAAAAAASTTDKDGKWSGLSFTVQPEDTVVRKRGPAWLHCVASGHPEPTLTWHRDNSPIDTTSDSRRYVLPNGTLHFAWVNGPRSEQTDEGVYQCHASSPGVGTIVSTGARLSIVGGWEEDALPKFDEQPEDMTVFEGERARFPCAINTTPPPSIKWFRNSHPLELDSRMTRLPSGALEIENVAATDDGEYYCQASSLDKSKVSQQATLQVREAFALRDPQRPMFIAQPKSAVGKIGDNITLDCAANGYPEPTVVWLKDGATIDMADLDTRFLFFGTTRSLQIIGLKEEDKGTYMCRAENREDSVDAVAHVQVQVAPKFVKRPVNKLAYEKEDVELECKVYGEPEPNIYWLKNGELLVETEYFQIVSGNNLKILGLVREDSGMYQCVAHNSAGDIQAEAQLKVLKSRRSSMIPSDPTVTTTTSSLIQGIPSGGSIPHGGGESEVLHPQAPSEPRLLQAIIASNRFITLAWHEPQFNNEHIVGYSVFYRQEDSLRERVQNVSASSSSEGLDEYKTQISDLIPGSNYMVRVVAHTSNGIVGASTPDVRVFTKPDLDLPSAPENLRAIPTSPTSLEITWSPPRIGRTPISGYTMFYMQVGSAEEHDVNVRGTSYDLQGLDQFTEYSVWLTAINSNGRGDATPEVTARTFSDVPSKEPQNITVEAASSRSLIISWEPPPAEHQNGIITGYKIRYKERGKSGSSKTKTTDGNRRLFPLTDLKKSTTYSIKLAAMTVNGTGPYTQGIQAETFANDLDENRVPGKPVALKAVALMDHIRVRWQPPAQHNVMLRGYTIGWGRGVPDIYSQLVDSKQRSYVIDKLEPNTEYVISLRAYNTVGDGQPVYEQVRTRPEEEEVAPTLDPPVGVKAVVLTPFTVALRWTDTTLNRNQYISDTRYYVVRYTTFSLGSSSSPRFRYINASDVTCLIDNLKPSTVYEFAVKTIKGRRESAWSLVASNTTLVARPSSPPRDVTVVTIPDEPSTVIFNWQPPKQNNGKITGYVIFYTTDPTVSDWVLENVMGDRMTSTVRGLTPSTQYFYKMHARNVKGFGPFSSVGNFTTLPAVGKSIGEPPGWIMDQGSLIVLVVAGVAGAVTLLGAFVAITLYCRKTKTEPRPSIVAGSCSKSHKPDVQPPDLWIHHDHLELKNFDKGERSASPNHAAIINHTGPEYEPDDKNTTYTSTSTLDRRTPYQSTYLRDQLSEDETDKLLNRRSFKPKPLILSMDCSKDLVGGSTSSSVYSDGTLGRPGYSMPQFSSAGSQGYNSPAENPYSPNPTSSGLPGSLGPGSTPLEGLSLPPQPSQSLLGSLGGPSCSSQYSAINGEGSNTLGKRSGNPLRSFSVPAPPQSAPTTPQPKHIVAVRPQGMTSPFKKSLVPGSTVLSSTGAPGGPSCRWTGPSMRVDSLPEHEEANEALLHGYSTEELSQEMANLEGLMKDLSAITANQFNC